MHQQPWPTRSNAHPVDGVVQPHALGHYDIVKQILPALAPLFSLLGDVVAWYSDMDKPQRRLPHKRPLASMPLSDSGAPVAAAQLNMTTIDQSYMSRHCIVCDRLTSAKQPICRACKVYPTLTTAVLKARPSARPRERS